MCCDVFTRTLIAISLYISTPIPVCVLLATKTSASTSKAVQPSTINLNMSQPAQSIPPLALSPPDRKTSTSSLTPVTLSSPPPKNSRKPMQPTEARPFSPKPPKSTINCTTGPCTTYTPGSMHCRRSTSGAPCSRIIWRLRPRFGSSLRAGMLWISRICSGIWACTGSSGCCL